MLMFDAVTRTNIPLGPPAVAGYLDGPRSAWSTADWNAVTRIPHLVISVLADDRANTMDVEYGNASALSAGQAAKRRQDRGQWTVGYCNKSTMGSLVNTWRSCGVVWQTPGAWPRPGAYLWVADPTGVSHLDVPGAPVPPIAVQDRWMGAFDISTTVGSFPALPAPPGRVLPVTVRDVVGGESTGDGTGYWTVGADGGVFAFGTAPFYGSLGGHALAAPIVGMKATPQAKGYWLFASDGGVFAFGDATFHGSLG